MLAENNISIDFNNIYDDEKNYAEYIIKFDIGRLIAAKPAEFKKKILSNHLKIGKPIFFCDIINIGCDYMIKNLKPSERFIKLLMDGKFKKPGFIKLQQLYIKKGGNVISNNLENYKFFINSSCYEGIEKVKMKGYIGDN